MFLLYEGFTCVTFTTGALAYYAPVYFETGIDSLGEGCPGYDPDLKPFDKGSVSFVIGAITAAAGGTHSFGASDFEAQFMELPLLTIKSIRSWWSSSGDAGFLLPSAKV